MSDNINISPNSIWQSKSYSSMFYIVLSINKIDDVVEYRDLRGGEIYMSYTDKFLGWFQHVQ